ncbi:unnamed protein product [Oncorhynchus mykiss]|uniref:Uncharacterized protein n=1 Tax=Oncorhynchus mykiss TaxID=8022 RepID=A0A060Z7T0_ONCMY|nr:unnamed protein product [Oncorhynchus mykiss]
MESPVDDVFYSGRSLRPAAAPSPVAGPTMWTQCSTIWPVKIKHENDGVQFPYHG